MSTGEHVVVKNVCDNITLNIQSQISNYYYKHMDNYQYRLLHHGYIIQYKSIVKNSKTVP